jgi:phosphatidylinositol-4,5-bisphosphate 3-kinase
MTSYYPTEYDILPRTGEGRQPKEIPVEFLMPNGLFLRMSCGRDERLTHIKSQVWKKAQCCPLYHRLLEPGRYSFTFINNNAEQEEVVDEERLLSDVRPYASVLRLVERKGDREEKIVSAKISMLIGKGLFEFTAMEKDNVEVKEFRRNMLDICSSEVRDRNSSSDKHLLYTFPPVLETSWELPPHIKEHLDQSSSGTGGTFLANVGLPSENQSPQYTFSIKPEMKPTELLQLVLQKKAITLNRAREDATDYVLKVSGQKDYLLAEKPVGMYKYVRKCIAKGVRPQLILVSRKQLLSTIRPEKFYIPTRRDQNIPAVPPKSTNNTLSLMTIKESVRLKVVKAYGVNISDKMKMSVRFGLYHGAEPLCELVQTRCILPLEDFNEDVIFNLAVSNLPQDARLCCVFNMVDGRRNRITGRRREERIPIAWCNTTMFDYMGQLRMGTMKLGFWPFSDEGLDEEVNAIGTTVSNPSTDAIQLEVEFQKFSQTVIYPELERLLELLAQTMEETHGESVNSGLQRRESAGASTRMTNNLQEIANRDSLQELCQQDKELMWSFRWLIRDAMPNALPKVLLSCRWNSYQHVAEMRMLLQVWEKVLPSAAIELLQHTSANSAVRHFAVNSLDELSDAELLQYLLQLVQALKYESYLDCPLARLLLKRALRSQHIGHFLFWHLRAEMHNPEVAVRFGLLLEAYCRGSPSHMETLSAQVNVVCKLKELSDALRTKTDLKDRREVNDLMREMLQSRSLLPPFVSPLNPSILLEGVKYDGCRVFDSKMKPLLLSFQTEDRPIDTEDDVQLIFKNGDGL